MNDRVLMALMAILEDFAEPPRSDWLRHEAEAVTFSRWAIEEMVNQIWDHPWTIASETVERFAMRLDIYADTANTDVQTRIFKIAAATAWELLDNIRELER